MDEQQIQEICSRCAAASNGPWLSKRIKLSDEVYYKVMGNQHISEEYGVPALSVLARQLSEEDARFISNARTDLPWAICELIMMKVERDCLAERCESLERALRGCLGVR